MPTSISLLYTEKFFSNQKADLEGGALTNGAYLCT